MKLSIVATMYKSEQTIQEFVRRADSAAQKYAGSDYEIVLVNDGSPDKSLELAVKLANENPHVVVVDLSRNFGHHKAMMTGLEYASGEHVFLLDSDLEEDPELLEPFSAQMTTESCDVVYGVQESRKGGMFEKFTGGLFYSLFRLLTGLELPSNIVVARIMTKRYVQALLQHRESEIFMAGLWLITGFDQRSQVIKKHSRGETTYTFRKKLSQTVNSITSFTNAPLVYIFFLGTIIFVLAGVFATWLCINWWFLASPPSGYTSLMTSIWFLGGMIIAFIGIVGIYLSKIYTETKNRPYTIVREIIGKNRSESTP